MPGLRSERLFRLDRLFRMETPAQYLKFAEECERLAKQARASHHRQVLEEMAQVWRGLANGADGKRDGADGTRHGAGGNGYGADGKR